MATDGAPGRSRTYDLSLRRRLLYPLSYWGGPGGHSCWKRPLPVGILSADGGCDECGPLSGSAVDGAHGPIRGSCGIPAGRPPGPIQERYSLTIEWPTRRRDHSIVREYPRAARQRAPMAGRRPSVDPRTKQERPISCKGSTSAPPPGGREVLRCCCSISRASPGLPMSGLRVKRLLRGRSDQHGRRDVPARLRGARPRGSRSRHAC